MNPQPRPGQLAQFGAALIGLSFVLFVVGLYPQLLRLDLNAGIGLLQIATALFGLAGMTLGAYIYMYATRHRAQPRRLREDVGVRLMATGLVVAFSTGLADVIGIGSHFGQQRPFFGSVQAWGVALGVGLILAGMGLYARR